VRVKCVRANLSLPLLSQYIRFSALDFQSRNSKNKVPRIRFCGPIKSSKNSRLVNIGKGSKTLCDVCSEDVEGVLVWVRRGDGWQRHDAQTGKSCGETFHGRGRAECAAMNKLEGRAPWDLKERFANCCLSCDANGPSQHTTGRVAEYDSENGKKKVFRRSIRGVKGGACDRPHAIDQLAITVRLAPRPPPLYCSSSQMSWVASDNTRLLITTSVNFPCLISYSTNPPSL
jgi:hypothetical protein